MIDSNQGPRFVPVPDFEDDNYVDDGEKVDYSM